VRVHSSGSDYPGRYAWSDRLAGEGGSSAGFPIHVVGARQEKRAIQDVGDNPDQIQMQDCNYQKLQLFFKFSGVDVHLGLCGCPFGIFLGFCGQNMRMAP